MKLLYSHNSPYARKCRVVLREKGLEGRVEEVQVVPMDNPPELLAVNPLGAVPALIANGISYCDSPVICEVLDSLSSDKKTLHPTEITARLAALRMAAFGDGLMDAAVACVLENRRPADIRHQDWIDRKEQAILRTLETLSKEKLPAASAAPHIGVIALACALDYIRFRLIHLQWQDKFPALAAWLEDVLNRPSFAPTVPMP